MDTGQKILRVNRPSIWKYSEKYLPPYYFFTNGLGRRKQMYVSADSTYDSSLFE